MVAAPKGSVHSAYCAVLGAQLTNRLVALRPLLHHATLAVGAHPPDRLPRLLVLVDQQRDRGMGGDVPMAQQVQAALRLGIGDRRAPPRHRRRRRPARRAGGHRPGRWPAARCGPPPGGVAPRPAEAEASVLREVRSRGSTFSPKVRDELGLVAPHVVQDRSRRSPCRRSPAARPMCSSRSALISIRLAKFSIRTSFAMFSKSSGFLMSCFGNGMPPFGHSAAPGPPPPAASAPS